MEAEGPYVSPWVSKPHFIVPDLRYGERCWTVVPNGVQRHEGMPFPSLRGARQWFKENGFEQKVKKSQLSD